MEGLPKAIVTAKIPSHHGVRVMGGKHEYSVIGHRRAKIAMVQAFLAGAIAGLLSLAATALINQLIELKWVGSMSVIYWPITGGAVFAILFALFEAVVWRNKWINWLVGIPDLSGRWRVSGQSFNEHNEPKFDWVGEITITQSYEKLKVYLKTETSSSSSVTAAIVPEGDDGFRLIYSYQNSPRPGNPELQRHLGHCELLFDKSLTTAEGDYFNNFSRMTHGTMKLKRK
ncbi:MAG: hypothetical protein NXH70_16405 [Hyphomonas sp.]|jgi:SMODS-associating 2TM, beta-strand rich effector domain|nr:hypothetical protein [Hyphomonas sp.]